MQSPTRALVAQRIGRASPLMLLVVALAGCPPQGTGGGGGGGITIPPSDATPPTVTLGIGQQNGPNVSVSAGGSTQNATLVRKTGPLNLLITANDPESGVQAAEIFYTSTVMYCDPSGCSGPAAHGLVGVPRFSSKSPQLQPGQTTSASRTLLDVLDLTAEIPQPAVASGSTRIVKLYLWGRARNNLGGTVTTPELVLTWKEP
jgi:hypothetical protein